MSHADADGPEPNDGESTLPPAAIPFPRTNELAHVNVECSLGEYYVTLWSDRKGGGGGDDEPSELTPDDAEEYARHITDRSALVRRLNGS